MTAENTDSDQSEYCKRLIWRLVGSRVTMFGANATGEIFMSVEKDGDHTKLVIGKDESGEVTLYEIEETKEEQQ